MRNAILRVLCASVLCGFASAASAQVTGKWDLATGFWADHVTPTTGASNDLAILAGNIAAGRTITNDVSVSLGGMYIGYNGNASRAVTLRPVGSETITFTNLTGGLAWIVKTNNANVAASATDTIVTPILLGANLAITNRSTYGGLTLSGNIGEVGGSRMLYVVSSLSGSNKVVLSGNNTFSGGVVLQSGSLQLGHTNALGTGALTINGGGLGTSADVSAGLGVTNSIILAAAGVVSNQNPMQLSGMISGGFSLAKWGTSSLILSGSNTYGGGTSLRAGYLRLGNVDALGSGALTINGGVLGTSTDLASGLGVTNSVSLGANSVVSNLNALQLSGNISGGFSLTKQGSGTLLLSGTNTYSGATVAAVGVLQFGKQVSLYNNTPASWTAANIAVSNGATLALNVGGAGEFTATDVQTIAGLGTGSGGFASGSFLGLDTSSGDFVYNNILSNLNAGANALGLVKLGANTLTLGGANTYTGGTTVAAGTLKLGAAERLADGGVLTVNNGGTFDLNGNSETVNYLAGTAGGVITNSGALADLILDLQNCNNRAASMDIRGDLRLIVKNAQTIRSGTTADQDYQQLNGTNTFTGGIVIDGGAVRANNDLALGVVPGAPDADAIILKNGGALLGTATYDLEVHPNRGIFLESGTGMLWTAFNSTPRTMTVWSQISGPGALFVTGDSKLLLMRDNTYEGITVLTQATLRVGHDLAVSTNLLVLGSASTLSAVSNDMRTLANPILVADATALGTAAVHTGMLVLAGSVDLGGAVRSITVNSPVEITGLVSNGGISKAGASVLTLSGSNTYDLGTTLNASVGRVRVGNDNALGVGVVTMGRTTLTATGAVARVITNHFVLGNDPSFGAAADDTGSLTLNSIDLGVATRIFTNHSDLIVSGVVSNGHLTKRGAGVMTLSGANTFTNLVLDAGTLALGADNVLGVGTLNFNGAATLRSSDATARVFTNSVTLSSGTTYWGAAGTGDLTVNSGPWNNGAAAKTLYISNNVTTFNAAWTNNNSSVTKLGPGTLAYGSTLAGANWIVNEGRLRLDAGGDMTNVATVVTIGAGTLFDVAAKSGWQMLGRQVVQGNGSVVGDVLAADGAQFIPGNAVAIGTLTFSNALTMTSGTTNLFDLGTLTGVGGGTNDLIVVGGALSAGSANILVNPVLPLTTGVTYRLFTYGGALSGSFAGVEVPGSRYTGVLTSGGGVIDATFSGAPLSLTWSGSAAGGVAGSTWDVTNAANWQAGAEKFYTMDRVTFDDSSPSNTVTLTGVLQPEFITVAGPSNYTLTGTGRITGTAGLLKTGAGTLTVATVNDYTGDTWVNDGVLRLGVSNALVLGTSAGKVYVTNGVGTLDLNRGTLGAKEVVIAGAGVGGLGAVVNNGSGFIGNALAVMSLTGDATIGGSQRWDFAVSGGQGAINGGSYTLTKTGANIISIKAIPTTIGAVHIEQGELRMETATTINPEYPITLAPGTINSYWNLTAPMGRDIFATNATIYAGAGAGASNTFTGTISAEGALTNNAAGVLNFEGAIVGSASLLKIGTSTLTLGGTNTYAGGTTIANGTLVLGPNGSISNTPSIDIATGKLLDVSQVAGGWTLYAHQTLSGDASVRGNVTALGAILPGASPGTMVFSNDLALSSGTLEMQLSDVGTVGGGVNDLVDVKGNLSLSGVSTVTVVPWSSTFAPNYAIMTYGGTLAGDASNLTAVPGAMLRPGYTFAFSTSTVGQVTLSVTGTEISNLLWSAGSASWDITNTVAWAGGQKFYQTDRVTFDDSGATGGDTNVVTFSERLLPTSITVNSASNYLLTGAGTIAGHASLTKSGAGTLILGTSNSIDGATAILGGQVVLGNANSLQYSAVSNAVNGGLAFSGATSFTIASLSGAGDIVLTNAAGAAVTLTLGSDNSSTVFGGALGGGYGAVSKLGTGTMTFTNAMALSGAFSVPSSTVIFNGAGTNVVGSDARIGTSAAAAVVQNDGVFVYNGGNSLLLGNGSGSIGTYTMNGGSLVATPTAANRGVLLGINSGGTGVFYMVGGSVTGKMLEVSRSDATAPTSVGYFNQSGGQASFAGLTIAGGSVINSSNNTAVLAISNGTFLATGFAGLAGGNDSSGKIYLGSGAQVTLPAFPTARGTNAYSEILFNGGTLSPLAASAAYMSGLTYAYLTASGATFNVGGGKDIGILQPFTNAAGQVGTLTKIGDGVLTLNGTNTYSGVTRIGAGAVTMGLTNALPAPFAASTYIVSNGATLAIVNGITEDEGALMRNTGNFAANSYFGFDTTAGNRTNVNALTDTGAGALGLAKLGANTLVITNVQAYTGGTKIFAGTLQVGDGGTYGVLGSGEVVDHGVLAFNRSDSFSFGTVISGSGSVSKAGAGALTFNAASLYTGSTTVRQGTVVIGIDNALPAASTVVLSDGAVGATLDASAHNQVIGGLSVISTNAASTNFVLIGAGQTLAVAGNVAIGANSDNSSANLVATGGGTLVVTNNGGTFRTSLVTLGTDRSGKTMVDLTGLGAFLMDLGSGSVTLSVVGDNNANDRSILILSASNVIRAATITVGGSNIGSINQLRLGSGTNILFVDKLNLGTVNRDCGAVLFDGATGGLLLRDSTGAGRVDVTMGTNANATGYVAGNSIDTTGHPADLLIGTLRMGEYGSRGGAWTNTFSFDQGVLDISNVVLSAACKAGVNGNSYLNIGGGVANLGPVSLSSSVATGTLSVTGGTVTMGGDISQGAGGRGVLTLNGGTLDLQNHAIGSAGAPINALNFQSGSLMNVADINGGAGLVKTTGGTLILTGTNTYTGTTRVMAGVLDLAGSGSLANSATLQVDAGAVIVASNRTATLHLNAGQTLKGHGTFAGGLVTDTGSTVAPGTSTGILTVNGNWQMDAGSTFEVELNGLTPGTGYDQLVFGGNTLTLNSPTLNVVLGFAPDPDVVFTIVSGLGSAAVGTFAGLPDGALVTNNVGGTDYVMKIDYNDAIGGGDPNNDITLTVVPEPAAFGLIGLGVMLLLARRRRSR